MTAPAPAPVNQFRARPGTIELAVAGTPAITIRVEVPEVWDVVRLHVSPGASVREVRDAALDVLQPDAPPHEDYVVKLRGWEVLDQSATLAGAGVVEGSTLLIHYGRKRPVR